MTPQIGDWEIRPDSNTLVKGGQEVRVTPRSMDVLVYLMEHAGEVVAGEQLLDALWGYSFASDSAVHKAVAELRKVLGDSARNPSYIETIPKRGYRVIADVRRVHAPDRVTVDGSEKSIGVLPFKNIDGDPSNQYLVEGLAETLLDGLAKVSMLNVASRTDSFKYSTDEHTTKEIGAALGVNHLLEGSIQRGQDRLRITVQLIRVTDGFHLYSHKFDIETKEVLSLQDEVATAVVAALKVHLDDKQRKHMLDWGTADADAYLTALEARQHYHEFNLEGSQRALDLFLAAIDHDPDFFAAYEGAAIAADRVDVYGSRSGEMSELLSQLHSRLAERHPNHGTLYLLRNLVIRLRAGTDHARVEESIRERIYAGRKPYNGYGHLLMGARLYEESLAYLDLNLISDFSPAGHAPDDERSVTSRGQLGPIHHPRINLLNRDRAIYFRKRIVEALPNAIGHLHWLVRDLARAHRWDEAEKYLAQYISCDAERTTSMAAGRILAAIRGDFPPGSADLEAALREVPTAPFHRGQVCFAAGDLERGISCWKELSAADFNGLRLNQNLNELLYPEWIPHDPRYHALLEDLGVGKSWQRYLMEKVTELTPLTGVELGAKARAAYEEDRFMIPAEPLTLEEVIRVPNELHIKEHGVPITLP